MAVDTKGSHACQEPDCGRKFDTKQALSLHMAKTHGKGKKKSTNRRASSNGRRETEKSENLETHIHYLFGRFERDLENYAAINRVPIQALAKGVASLLGH